MGPLCLIAQPVIFPIQYRLLSLPRHLSERWDRAPGPVGRPSQSRPLAAHRFAAAGVCLPDTMGLCLALDNEIMSSLRKGWSLC